MKDHEISLLKDLFDRGCTPFQIEVYQATSLIPYGETRSYLEIASQIGRPKAARAVGSALKRNPFPGERVPCHRVIHASGNTTGYMGSTDPKSSENKRKKNLLATEARNTHQKIKI
jgi:O-6-methylguanine DNA methyltransferase